MLKDKKLLRLIDANYNRCLEGLRVCEEIMRFVLSNKNLTRQFKNLRHVTGRLIREWSVTESSLLSSRASAEDVGNGTIASELRRDNYKDIFFANIQRVKESLRVLEEFAKLDNRRVSSAFKEARYKLYRLEREANSRF